ncbi:unnamed protein product, partial [Lymnaea stagnalis]
MQAKFAGLNKMMVKGQLLRDSLDTFLTVSSGFFHYHHEEVQYWVSVFTNIFRCHQPLPRRQSHLPLTRKKSIPSPVLLIWMEGKNFSTVVEVTEMSSTISTAACSGIHCQLSQARLNAIIKPGGGVVDKHEWFSSYNGSCEVDIQNVSCCLVDARLSNEQMRGRKHYWGTVFYLGTLLMKARIGSVKKLSYDVKVEGMEDNLQVEWSSGLYSVLNQLISAFRRVKPLQPAQTSRALNVAKLPVVKNSLIHMLKLDISNINLFISNSVGVCAMLRVDTVALLHNAAQTTLCVDGTKVQYIICDKEFFPLNRSNEIHKPAAHIHQVKVKFTPSNKECRVHILQHLTVQWTNEVHMCLVKGVQEVKTLQARLSLADGDATSPCESMAPPPHPPQLTTPHSAAPFKSDICINILILAEIHLEAKLSKQHMLSIQTQNLLVTMTLPEILMEVKDFNIKCDGNNIFKISGFQLETLAVSYLKVERERAKTLQSPTNKAWSISFDSVEILFPHQYNFADCYEEVINTVKWLKLVHKMKRQPFTAESPLPPDLTLSIKMLSIEMSDNPFEVKMGLNYELLKDEGIESKKRKEVMDMKLMDLQKKQFIPVNKREELYASLHKKSSEIYIQRSQKLCNDAPIRTQLFTWLMEDVQITALADVSFHGKDNVLKHMQEIDKESPFPKEAIDFVTLWCRYINASVKLWSVSLRDFPRPMIDVQNKHVWGRLIGAERDGTKR